MPTLDDEKHVASRLRLMKRGSEKMSDQHGKAHALKSCKRHLVSTSRITTTVAMMTASII